MAAGDDISLAFNEVPITEGMERDYILLSDAYWKEHPEADDYVGIRGIEIGYLSLPFIPPLGSNYCCRRHSFTKGKRIR